MSVAIQSSFSGLAFTLDVDFNFMQITEQRKYRAEYKRLIKEKNKKKGKLVETERKHRKLKSKKK